MTTLTVRDLCDDPVAVAELPANMGRCPWGSWRRSGLWSAVRLEGPQTTTHH